MDTSNYVYLAITAHFRGWGETELRAIGAMQRAGGGPGMKKHGYSVYRVHPDFQVDCVDGSVLTPVGHPAIKVTEKRIGR